MKKTYLFSEGIAVETQKLFSDDVKELYMPLILIEDEFVALRDHHARNSIILCDTESEAFETARCQKRRYQI